MRVVDFKPQDDEQLTAFLRAAGLDEDDVQPFVDQVRKHTHTHTHIYIYIYIHTHVHVQKFTYEILVRYTEKEDLAFVVPCVGTRVK